MNQNNKQNLIIDRSKYKIQLMSVNFDYIEPKDISEDIVEFESTTKDNYSIINLDNKFVEIEFVRKVFLEPKALFDIEIKFNLRYAFNEEKEDLNLKEIKEEIQNRIEELFLPVTTKASILIGNITNISEDIPLVVPPFPLFDDDLKRND